MDLGVDLVASMAVAEQSTASVVAISEALSDYRRASVDVTTSLGGAPAIADLAYDIVTDWLAELDGAEGQATDSTQRLRQGIEAFVFADKALAKEAPKAASPGTAGLDSHGRIPQ